MKKRNKKSKQNKANSQNRVMLQCRSLVNKDAVRRETIDGIEHIICSSFTMPDDICMNGILYPAQEIADSFSSLERTLAPVEHPIDSDGRFISASDPVAIHNFHAGAFNMNVTRENGRVHIEKFINVPEAMKTDRGKRLLDRIEEIETNENPRPIHTSTGVFLVLEDVEGVRTNKDGHEYHAIARDLSFDHDSILLDSQAAALPSQGVGMAVNADGQTVNLHQFELPEIGGDPVPDSDELSHSDIRDLIMDAISQPPFSGDWIVDVFESELIFESKEQLFSVPYIIDGKQARITGIPIAVERDVSYTPRTNHQEGDKMKDMIINALKAAGVEVDGLDDDALFAKFSEMKINESLQANSEPKDEKSDDAAFVALNEAVTKAVESAIAPVANKLEAMETKLNATETAELEKFADMIGNSDVYQDITKEDAVKLGINTLKAMAANCNPSYGINSFTPPANGGAETFTTEMPE